MNFHSKTGKNGQTLRGEQRQAKAEFRKHKKTRFGKQCLTKIDVFEASNKTESERSKKLTGKQ